MAFKFTLNSSVFIPFSIAGRTGPTDQCNIFSCYFAREYISKNDVESIMGALEEIKTYHALTLVADYNPKPPLFHFKSNLSAAEKREFNNKIQYMGLPGLGFNHPIEANEYKGFKWQTCINAMSNFIDNEIKFLYTSEALYLRQRFPEPSMIKDPSPIAGTEKSKIARILNSNSGIHFLYLFTIDTNSKAVNKHVICCINTGEKIIFFEPYHGVIVFEKFESFIEWFNKEASDGALEYFFQTEKGKIVQYIEIASFQHSDFNFKLLEGIREVFCAWCEKKETDSNKLLRCKRCKTVRYCGLNCQRQHWQSHKDKCQTCK